MHSVTATRGGLGDVAALLLDTTVLIDLLRGRSGAVQRIRELRYAGVIPYVCAVNVEEIVRGLREHEYDTARTLFNGMRLVPLSSEEGWRAGEWRRSFARRGRTLAQADCLIAAAALSVRGHLATGNPKDFPMGEVVVEHWPTGE